MTHSSSGASTMRHPTLAPDHADEHHDRRLRVVPSDRPGTRPDGRDGRPASGDGATAGLVTFHADPVVPAARARLDAGVGDARAPRQLASALRRNLKPMLVVLDIGAIVLGAAIALLVQTWLRPVSRDLLVDELVLLAVTLPVYLIGAAANHLYRSRAIARRSSEWASVIRAAMLGVGATVIVAFLIQNSALSRVWILMLFVGIASVWVAERELVRAAFTRMRREGRLRRRVAVLGSDTDALDLDQRLRTHRELGYDSVGMVDGPEVASAEGFEELTDWLASRAANGVIVSPNSFSPRDLNRITRRLTEAGFHTNVASVLHDIDVGRIRPQQFDGSSVLYVEPVRRNGWRRLAKRAFDLTGVTLLLVVTAPLLLVAALAVRFTSSGPVIFRQERVGQDGRRFDVLKLRTMVADAEAMKDELASSNEADGPLFKMEHDPRVTRVGRVLRKTSLDELPQLINVLRGEMSLVGPRPALPDEMQQWDDELTERLRVLPGITGLWQVSGRSSASFDEYRRLDLFYVDNWSLLHDLEICLRTIRVVVSGHGAS